ncbi:hypothetical protein HB364_11515 [Pseudoflavitalea sp. X16]|uniref:hypothetical protein n=1 Tax=Paraflavitalea devenefica TaxID=2716334 RepID=UPI0014248BA4|nr:hypothetical protein [Paraflavitalea devenefica]NII25715.1 hypothetical protein [Paraflavitalea devenefica]
MAINLKISSMRYLIIYLGSCLLLMSFRCGKLAETRNSFSIKNNAAHSISFYVAAVGIQHKYPDTAIENNQVPMQSILPGKSADWGTGLKWEEFFKALPTDTLSVYLFHPDTLQKYNWAVIRDQYKVLRRYDLSLQDLKGLNFEIPYP